MPITNIHGEIATKISVSYIADISISYLNRTLKKSTIIFKVIAALAKTRTPACGLIAALRCYRRKAMFSAIEEVFPCW